MKRLLGLFLFACAAAQAQPFPSRPINILVPLEPGSALDTLGRAMIKPLGDRVGVPVLVENRPGANFTIAASACAKAKPDGYTLCMLPRDNISILPFEGPVPYDAQKDFEPLANLAWINSVMVVGASFPANTFQELVAYGKANPNKLFYTAFGSAQLSTEWVKKQSGLDMTFVPFKGSPAALQAFFGGQLQVFQAATAAPGMMGMIKSGKVRALMVPGEARNPQLPDVPSAVEVGLPNFTIQSWLGMFSAAGTPKDVVSRLSAEFVALVKAPDFRDKYLVPFGYTPIGMAHDEFARYIARDMKMGAELVNIVGPRTR